MQKSTRNREVLELVKYQKTLTYFATALRSNEVMMERVQRMKLFNQYDEDADLLEDVITENQQAIQMTSIATEILSGMMDAFASIISNNLNGVMKALAALTIVLNLPTIVASFYGMNVDLPRRGSPFAFPIILGFVARADHPCHVHLRQTGLVLMQAELLLEAKAILGEGPAWDEKTQTLYWVDILAKRVHAWKEGRDDFLQLDEFVGCVAPRRDGGLVAALRTSFWTLDLTTGTQALLASVSEPDSNRFNDGKCDPAGRLLAGTMDMDEKSASGNFYSLEAGKPPRKLLDGIRISNGLAWSPDHKIFYYIDTPTRQVRAFDYDLETGNISNPRVAVEIPPGMGFPDGMTSDMEGRLWIALWGGCARLKMGSAHGSAGGGDRRPRTARHLLRIRRAAARHPVRHHRARRAG